MDLTQQLISQLEMHPASQFDTLLKPHCIAKGRWISPEKRSYRRDSYVRVLCLIDANEGWDLRECYPFTLEHNENNMYWFQNWFRLVSGDFHIPNADNTDTQLTSFRDREHVVGFRIL